MEKTTTEAKSEVAELINEIVMASFKVFSWIGL